MKVDRSLGWAVFAAVAMPVLAGPWLFGGWETWYFWPLCGLLFASLVASGLRLVLAPSGDRVAARAPDRLAIAVWIAASLTLLYVAIRFVQSPVYLDAERSFLLFLMPAVVAAQVAFGMTPTQRRILWLLLLYNFLLLGVYGIANHLVTGSRLVLWRPGYEQYWNEGRASGSYFCPDHFAGAMEIALAMGLGLLLSRGHGWGWRAAGAALGAAAMAAVIMSKSKGGGLTVLVMFAAVLTIGFAQRSLLKRWCWRTALVSLGVIGLVGFLHADSGYMKRCNSYFGPPATGRLVLRERLERIRRHIEPQDRWQMISAALRGWKMAPVFGMSTRNGS